MKILIAGATGYLGGLLAAHLANAGHTVEGTSRHPSDHTLPQGVSRLHQWSTDEPLSAEAIEGSDAIVLLTGDSVRGRWTDAKKRTLRSSRVDAARNLVAGIEASPHKPSVLVGGSAGGYYGDGGERQLTEDMPPGDDFLARLTADWEAEVNRTNDLGVRVVNIRTAHVIGAGSPYLAAQIPIWKWGVGARLGNGKQWVAWVHVDDYTAILRLAIETDTLTGPINVVAPGAVRQWDFAKALGRALRRPVFGWAPAFLVRILLGEMAIEVLSSRRIVPTVLAHHNYTFAHPTLASALNQAIRS